MNKLVKNIFAFVFFGFFLNSYLICEEITMQSFLNEYHSSIEKNQNNYTKLLFAMEKNYRNIAISLIENGENPNYILQNKKTLTPFMFAILYNDEDLVKKMLDKGADANLNSSYSEFTNILISPLYLAVYANDDAKITKLLCDSGAKTLVERITGKITWYYWSYYNPLKLAIENVDYEKFTIIANTLSDQEIKTIDGEFKNILSTPMHWYNSPIDGIEDSINIVNYLLSRGGLIETEKGSALSAAAECGNIELMKFLISFGANLNYKTTYGYYLEKDNPNPVISALRFSQEWDKIIKNNININWNDNIPAKFDPLKLILENQAEINVTFPKYFNVSFPETSGFSPLGYALYYSLNEAAELLIAYGADVNILEASGKNPLIRATEAKNLTGVLTLLNAGADPTLTGTGSNKSAIDIAYSLGYLEILNALIEAEARMY